MKISFFKTKDRSRPLISIFKNQHQKGRNTGWQIKNGNKPIPDAIKSPSNLIMDSKIRVSTSNRNIPARKDIRVSIQQKKVSTKTKYYPYRAPNIQYLFILPPGPSCFIYGFNFYAPKTQKRKKRGAGKQCDQISVTF